MIGGTTPQDPVPAIRQGGRLIYEKSQHTSSVTSDGYAYGLGRPHQRPNRFHSRLHRKWPRQRPHRFHTRLYRERPRKRPNGLHPRLLRRSRRHTGCRFLLFLLPLNAAVHTQRSTAFRSCFSRLYGSVQSSGSILKIS